MNGDNRATLESMVAASLASGGIPTPESIRSNIAAVRTLSMCAVTDDEAEHLARFFEEQLGVSMALGAVLQERDFIPWLPDARSSIDPYFWTRYRQLLVDKGFPGQVLASLDEVTERILGLLGNPKSEAGFDRRGMVVGYVQSGKTANYTGLVCKAADAGYKLIVIIAGIHNNLRNQTQARIDEGFVGQDSARLLSGKAGGDRAIGVGRFSLTHRPVTFTNTLRDFNKNTATSVGVEIDGLKEPAVLVIKKNSSTLKNLIEWLREHSARRGSGMVDAPMLLIDDEADNASINVKHGKDEVSRINGQIRELLQLFSRSCYVGYTATPFANIFIEPETAHDMLGEDLFPRNFIVSLDPPSNYVGPDRVFLDEEGGMVRHIEDAGDLLPMSHTNGFRVEGLPESLKDAVRAFIVARAIRLLRNQLGQHSSMLVNASRFTNVQTQLRNEIHAFLGDVQSSVRVNAGKPESEALESPEIRALRDLWATEYSNTEFSWSKVQQVLNEAASPITVVEVNSRSSGTLNYSDHDRTGLNVIAVGGFSLSRGLTLEGLMISYFLRNSVMYDTLMQMGRWFGYRPGYDDLCRVWMPEEAEGWYAHIAESIELLRGELRAMEAAGATPEEFGLKVRGHPDTLMVTARNKMGSGEKVVVNIGLANNFLETAVLRRDAESLKINRNAAINLVGDLKQHGKDIADAETVPYGKLIRKAPVDSVLKFLAEFRNHVGSMLTDGDPVRRYISERADGELKEWDILFSSLEEDAKIPDNQVTSILGSPIRMQARTAGEKSNRDTLYITNKQRVSSRGVERTGLSDDARKLAEAEYRLTPEATRKDPARPLNYPDRIYRGHRPRPLLILHLLAIREGKNAEIDPEPVVAWSISFPTTQLEEKRVEYVVNLVWYRQNFADDLAEDEMGGDVE